jgi:hypothetical protein
VGGIANDQREPFVREFERLLDGPVTLNTIDEIWYEYVRHNPRARPYLKYLPTTPQMLQTAEELKNHPQTEALDIWVKKLEERERLEK